MSPTKRVSSLEELMTGEIGLVAADMKTGVTTDIAGHWLIATPVSYLVFPSMELANEYARGRVAETPEIEWMFYDRDGYVSLIRAQVQALPVQAQGRLSRLWAAIKKMAARSS